MQIERAEISERVARVADAARPRERSAHSRGVCALQLRKRPAFRCGKRGLLEGTSNPGTLLGLRRWTTCQPQSC
jgi:hypothetical protein